MAINKRLIKSNEGGAAVPTSFNTVLYNGVFPSYPNVTGVGFTPDVVWIKNRDSSGENHNLTDVVSGFGKILYPNLTNAQGGSDDYLVSQITDGFSVNTDNANVNGNRYVAWCWKAGGAAVTNTDGTITSQVSANTEAGFSIVTGSVPSSGFTNTFGHGLNDTPKIVISKVRNDASDWVVSNSFLANNCLILNTTAAAFSDSGFAQTSTTIKTAFTTSAFDFVAYCFAEVAGFSKFGSYSGIDDTDVKVYTDSNGDGTGTGAFQPRFVMIKLYNNTGGSWAMFDALRDGGNPTYNLLFANLANAESTYSNIYGVQFDSDGFTVKGHTGGNDQINETGGSYIFMAFA